MTLGHSGRQCFRSSIPGDFHSGVTTLMYISWCRSWEKIMESNALALICYILKVDKLYHWPNPIPQSCLHKSRCNDAYVEREDEGQDYLGRVVLLHTWFRCAVVIGFVGQPWSTSAVDCAGLRVVSISRADTSGTHPVFIIYSPGRAGKLLL